MPSLYRNVSFPSVGVKSDITAREIFHPGFLMRISNLKSITNMTLFMGYTFSYPEEYSKEEQNK